MSYTRRLQFTTSMYQCGNVQLKTWRNHVQMYIHCLRSKFVAFCQDFQVNTVAEIVRQSPGIGGIYQTDVEGVSHRRKS